MVNQVPENPAAATLMAPAIADELGRSFGSLRISVTPACNMSCAYCNPERLPMGAAMRPPEFYLALVEKLLSVQAFGSVHITGGEPGLYRDLPALVLGLRQLGVPRISLTTNGVRLRNQAEELRAAGLTDCNVSMDALSKRRFLRMTGTPDRDRVLAGIHECLQIGLPVKVNSTLMRGRNEREILPLFEYFSARAVTVRYLELMRMGPMQDRHAELLFPEAEILNVFSRRYDFEPETRTDAATARYFRLSDGRRFGVIANHSTPFCSDCDRLRLSHDGRLFGCISSARSQALPSDADETVVRRLLVEALAEKQQVFVGSTMNMQAIGG